MRTSHALPPAVLRLVSHMRWTVVKCGTATTVPSRFGHSGSHLISSQPSVKLTSGVPGYTEFSTATASSGLSI